MYENSTHCIVSLAHIIPALRPFAEDISSLHLGDRTPVVHTKSSNYDLQHSVAVFGQYRPVVARLADRKVVIGTGLMYAMASAGYLKIACVFVDVDDIVATAMALVDNRLSRVTNVCQQQAAALRGQTESVYPRLPGWTEYEMDGARFDRVRAGERAAYKDCTSWIPDGLKR